MHFDRTEDVERGMQLVSRLPEVMPDQADERIRRIYEDSRDTLRVPFVNFVFRTLANYPAYLAAAWEEVRPYLRTRAFEGVADELRALALLEPVPDSSGRDWAALGDLKQIRPFTDSIHYVLPKLLLLATAFDQDLEHGAQQVRPGAAAPSETAAPGPKGGDPTRSEIPLGVAEGTASVPMVSPQQATGKLEQLFDAIKRRHQHPGVATYYRSLGHWPDFLQACWERIEPLVGSPAYEARKRALLEQAQAALGPAGVGAAAKLGLASDQIADLRAVLAIFRFKFIPDLLLDFSLIKAMLDGPEAARRSRFSMATPA